MGTSYTILEKEDATLRIDEHSNLLDLVFEIKNANIEVPNLTPDDLKKVIIRLTEVWSYWASETHTLLPELKRVIPEL